MLFQTNSRPRRHKRPFGLRPKRYVPQLVLLLAAALIIIFLHGCGKEPAQGPIGYPGAAGPKGDKGDQGEAAEVSPYSIVSVLDPCGDAPGVVDEVLLKLSNGQVLVSFSASFNGHNTRLALLPPGTYSTTDGSNCIFTLHSNGTVTN